LGQPHAFFHTTIRQTLKSLLIKGEHKSEKAATQLEQLPEGGFYNYFPLHSLAPNRKEHIPYVLKALILNNPE
jgi:hypothetical protein